MANSTVYHLGGADGESFSTKRKTGWIPLTDMARNTTIRRFNARYKSPETVTAKIYSNGDDTNSLWEGSLKANDGDSGVNINGAVSSTTATSITVDINSIFKDGDWVKIGNEIMKIDNVPSATSITVERGGRGTTASTHSDDANIHYANYPNDSIAIGRRANSIMVEVLTSASTSTSLEIGKLEVEVDGKG